MGKATSLVPAVALALALPACGTDTGIVLEISMSPELVAELDAEQRDFELLRVWVGHATDDPAFFRASGDGFMNQARNRAGMAEPFRYLLEPTGELAAIGELRFAAAVGDDPDDQRLPFRVYGFDVSDAPMGFADGEIRVVPLVLMPPDGVLGTIDDACIVWGMESGQPQRIAPDDDLDCDGAIGDNDCDDLDPNRNHLDRDGDTFSSCDGDCMDDPHPLTPWLDPATVNPGAIDIGENDPLACDHVDEDCDGNCQTPNLDADGSGSTGCGLVTADRGVCEVMPADCSEQVSGNQALGPAPEACNARDDACDGLLPPKLPCLIHDLDGCHWGEVACDELEGEYRGENADMLECKLLPAGFSDFEAPPALCAATAPSSCLEAGDPIGCAFEGQVTPRASCSVTAHDECRPDRTPLQFPGASPPDSCEWLVVGGTQQAEWEIGFVLANAPLDATPMAFSQECRPELAVRPRTPTPSPRSVLLLLRSPQSDAFGVRPLVVHLDTEIVGKCSGFLSCSFDGAN